VPAVATYSPTGNSYVDGLLTGTKWAVSSLTYSFPTDASFYGSSYAGAEPMNNFKAFTSVQQGAVRTILHSYESVANLSFTQVSESSTQHGDLRYAGSDAPSTAWAYYPSTNDAGGDAWFNNSNHFYDNPVKGNYAYLTMLHETGHALGLKHPHEVKGSFGALPVEHDSLEYSVMSYRSYVGASTTTGYTNDPTSYPQSLMMDDIAALQAMYGANYTTNSGDTVYKWSSMTGEMFINGVGQGAPAGNKIFLTIWDGGGHDTYDFSNYGTDLRVDLQPGAWTTVSTAQLADLDAYFAPGAHLAAGNIANALLYNDNPASLIEDVVGGWGNDVITGNIADNVFTGAHGNDALDGGAGTNTAVYSGLFAEYQQIQNADGSWTLTDLRSGSPDGTDTLAHIQLLHFADGIFTLGTTPAVVNHAPTITSGAQVASAVEWADRSANELANTPHTAAGTITYADADASDTHTASFMPQSSGYLGTFSLAALNDAGDSLDWSFSVADNTIDSLPAGQTLTQLYDVIIDDGHGSMTVETVTVTITGASDGKSAGNNGGKKAHAPGVADDFGRWDGSDLNDHGHSARLDMSNDGAPAPLLWDGAAAVTQPSDHAFTAGPDFAALLQDVRYLHASDLLLV
jgi:VCBS repeat-containing protein